MYHASENALQLRTSGEVDRNKRVSSVQLEKSGRSHPFGKRDEKGIVPSLLFLKRSLTTKKVCLSFYGDVDKLSQVLSFYLLLGEARQFAMRA